MWWEIRSGDTEPFEMRVAQWKMGSVSKFISNQMIPSQSTYAIRQNLNLVPTVALYAYETMTDTAGQEVNRQKQGECDIEKCS